MTLREAPRENPFATRFTRPGAIPFLFPDGVTTQSLVDHLEAANWVAQIVGPHGAGKTTLLRTLEPEIERRGRQIAAIALHDGQRQLPADFLTTISNGNAWQVIVDGYEQLGRRQQRQLQKRCVRLGCGLLVTAHRDSGLPTLFEVQPRLSCFQEIARALAAPSGWTFNDGQLADVYARHKGNVRESLFELYDLYQLHSRTSAGRIVSNRACDSD